MLRILTAHTDEIDSPKDAAADILRCLPQAELLAASVGILSCHPDFLHSGAAKAVCEALPFPVIGATTIACGNNEAHGLELLSLCVLTGDDVDFTVALTEPLTGAEAEEAVAKAYTAALTEAGGKPGLIFAYAPFLAQLSGESIVNKLNALSGGVPVFGTVGCDQNSDFRDTFTLVNGEHYPDRLALILVNGNIAPRFFVLSVSEGNIQKQKGIITDSSGNILKSVNDLACVDYMASIGLNPNDGLEGTSSIPFMVDYYDGSPPAGRSVYTFTAEGYGVCGGEMPLNAGFSVGVLDSREITKAGERLFASIMDERKAQGLLVISCIGRSLALGLEPLAELETVRRAVGDATPLYMAYSGGEICPVYTGEGLTVNRFHNFTLVVCVL